jgi:hypothetical protein
MRDHHTVKGNDDLIRVLLLGLNVQKDELQETYFSLVYKQGKLGSWRGKDDIGILKMTSTIVDVLLQGVSKRTNDPRLQKSIPV